MRKWLVALAGSLWILAGCQKEKTEVPELLEPVDVKMDLTEVERGDIFQVSSYQGEVVPYVEELGFPADGTLGEVSVLLGDKVKAGQVLMTLDNRELEHQKKKLEQEIADMVTLGSYADRQITTRMQIASQELAMMQETGSSQEDIHNKMWEIETLQLALDQQMELRNVEIREKQRLLEELRIRIGKNQVTAPFDGTVMYIKDVRPGDWVREEEPAIFLVDETRLTVRSEHIWDSKIAKADRVYAKIQEGEYELTYLPYGKEDYIAMSLTGEELDTRFGFSEPDEVLKAGQYAAILVEESFRENVLTVPVNALYKDVSGQYVYKMMNGERVRCDVAVGVITEVKAEILEGLQEGDTVILKPSVQASDRTEIAGTGDFVQTVIAPLEVQYPIQAEIAWEGDSVHFKETSVIKGQVVKEGDVLMVFDVADNKAEVEEKKRKLARLSRETEQEKTDRISEIQKKKEEAKGSSSHKKIIRELEAEWMQAEYEEFVYRSDREIKVLTEQIQHMEERIRDNQVTAPFDGVIDSVASFHEGDKVNGGQVVVTMHSDEVYYLKAMDVNGNLRYNMDVEVMERNNTYSGRVIGASNLLPSGVASTDAFVQIEETADPEQMKNIRYQCNKQEVRDVLLVPQKAVKKEGDKEYVNILIDGKAQKRYVITGLTNGEETWVLDGVTEGQQIVTN